MPAGAPAQQFLAVDAIREDVIVLKDGSQPTEECAEQLRAFVKETIAPFKYPRWIEFVSELPKTATGKIQRFKLRGSLREP